MKKDVIVYIEDILDGIAKIEEYTKKITENNFNKSTKIQDAVLRRLEIIGEAVKNIPQEMRGKYPDIPWKKIAGTGDVLIHEYSGVNLKRIWKVIKEDLIDLKRNIQEIKKDLKNSNAGNGDKGA